MKRLFIFIGVLFGIISSGYAVSSTFNSNQVEQIETIVHNYLLKNPNVLLEVAQKLQEQDLAKQNTKIEAIKKKIPLYKKELFDTTLPGRIVMGNPKGKVLLVEVLQYQCGHCRVVEPMIEKLVKDNNDIKLIVLQWPFFGNDAIYAAKAVIAAQKQGKFLEMHNALLTSPDVLTKDKTDIIIRSIKGLDVNKLYVDMKDKALEKALKDNFQLSLNLGLIGTPTFIFANSDLTKFDLIAGQTQDTQGDLNRALRAVR